MTLHWIADGLNVGAAGSLANLLRKTDNMRLCGTDPFRSGFIRPCDCGKEKA